MLGSLVLYTGLILGCSGAALFVRPRRRRRAMLVAAAGAVLVGAGMALPAPESRVSRVASRLDEFMPAWQFNEIHTLRIAAPPTRVYEAIKQVRADEIALFRTLTWIRRGGKDLPEGILNAGTDRPLLDIATSTSFIWLADDPPREAVVGTIIRAPRKTSLSPELFKQRLPPDFTIAAMNFIVKPDGANGSLVSTETRVYANSDAARRRFAGYWRVIYPGSALVRRMWLRAIARRSALAE